MSNVTSSLILRNINVSEVKIRVCVITQIPYLSITNKGWTNPIFAFYAECSFYICYVRRKCHISVEISTINHHHHTSYN